MTAKGKFVAPLNNQPATTYFADKNDAQKYADLNLNQYNECSNFNPVHSKTISNTTTNKTQLFGINIGSDPNKLFVGIAAAIKSSADRNYHFETKTNFNSWRDKSTKPFETLFDGQKSNNDQDKSFHDKSSNLKRSNSTLSLHIAAYENAHKNLTHGKLLPKDVKQMKSNKSFEAGLTGSSIQNLYEFPRQQEEKVYEPEVMQFKASQRLSNPRELRNSEKPLSEYADKSLMSSAGMPSSMSPSPIQPATQPIISHTTRKRMYPRISKDHSDKALVSMGEMVRQRWLIKGMIGSGGYGQIYYALDTRQNDHVAVKVEPTRRNGKTVRRMILEQKVLLRLQGRAHVALMYGSGVEHDLNYIVLQLLSVNLGELRKQCPLKRFSKSTAGRIMQQAVAGIRDIHQIGYLHRDIKPANMCFGLSEASKHRLIIVDFGLVRKYVNADGRVRPLRDRAGFRGTLRYVSLRVHDRQEQGPADDLIALLYSLIEMVHGELSWRKMNDPTEIRAAKEDLIKDDFRTVSYKFGNSFRDYARAVSLMSATEEPNYRVLQQMMSTFAGNKSISADYDWENEYADVIAETEINRHLKIIP